MPPKYPLEQLAQIKERRLEEAERLLKEKKEALEKEKKKESELKEKRDQSLRHKQDKLAQLREALDEGSTSDKIEGMRIYIKLVEEELKQKEKRLEEQQKKVKEAKKEVEEARADVIKKQHDVEKLKIHKEEWEKEMKQEFQHLEGIETDDLGTAIYITKKHKK